jgi:predicted negative regulator of RcsB-dependent stress response
MDSRERHELKENELAEILTNFRHWWTQHGGPWWAKNGNTFLLTVLVAMVVVVGYRWYQYNAVQSRNAAWADLAATSSPSSYRAVADAYDLPTVQALANLRGADVLLKESYSQTGSADDAANEAHNKLNDAITMYQNVLNITEQPLFCINAIMGLAAASESLEQWDDAEKYYQQAIDLGGANFPVIVQQAELRKTMLAQLQQPIVFGPELPPVVLTPETAIPETVTPPADDYLPSDQVAP